jgi:hypothetical protein
MSPPQQTRLSLAFVLLVAVPLVADDQVKKQLARPASTAPAERTARAILAKFDRRDPGWNVRMEALVTLVKTGPAAVPVLAQALQSNSPLVREFAAQVLAVLAEPSTWPALERALTDPDSRVRIYAVKALSLSGRLVLLPKAQRQKLLKLTRPGMMRDYINDALRRDDKPDPQAIRKALRTFDPATMDIARLGQAAPDFALPDALGKTHRLSQFRTKKMVVLEFHSGDN